jgi:hypothetical protein
VEDSSTTADGGTGTVAFIRKRGQSYYLVHNVRKKGRVQQLHLANLGRRPRISEEIIQGVASKHPFVEVDWQRLKAKTLPTMLQPMEIDSAYVKELLSTAHNLNLDVAGLHFPSMEIGMDRALVGDLVSALQLLRTTLDVKLRSQKLLSFDGKEKDKGRSPAGQRR